MSSISQTDLDAMRARTERARNPAKAAQQDAAQAEKFAAGEERKLSALFAADLIRRGIPFICAPTHRKSALPVGWPDYTIFRNEKTIFIELKVEGGALEQTQKDCIARLESQHFVVGICWNLQQAIDFVRVELYL